MKTKLKIVIVGVGGVGGRLLLEVARFCQYQSGFETQITAIDGDSFEIKNADRQFFAQMGNKAAVKIDECVALFDRVSFTPVAEFLKPDNIEFYIEDGDGSKEISIVFVCVDNHVTRRLIDEFVGTLQNVVLINGGNKLVDGNVQICIRQNGQWLTETMSSVHREVAEPKDKSPHQMSCEEMAKTSEPQLSFANLMVTALMCAAFYDVLQNLGDLDKMVEIAEAFFDLTQMSVVPYSRPAANIAG